LLSDYNPKDYGTYGFRFKGRQQQSVAGIHSLGWEKQTSTSYDWNGLTRSEVGRIVFQYTLNGKGEIVLRDEIIGLESGDAFLVKIPSNHRYYLPKTSKEWEFVHLTLFGDEVINCYEFIESYLGNIIKLNLDSTPIKLFFKLFEKASNNEITDSYEASSFAYSFIMGLYRYVLNIRSNNKEWPEPVTRAVLFINNMYAEPIGLDEIVDASGLSKYHFTRLFHKTTNLTPVQYVTKTRIDKAVELLKNEELTIDDIAITVGYSNGNYFNKVFRSLIGVPPGQFRKSKSFVPVDHLILDY
jgi:AraC-like DNA-binding protein